MKIARVLLLIVFVFALVQPPHIAQAATDTDPSMFGYTVIPGSSWEEINLTGTILINNADNAAAAVPLPFAFKFFENSYITGNLIQVSPNGFIAFNTLMAGYAINKSIPLDELPNNIIAPFWDDLAVGGLYNSGEVFYQTVGAYPQQRFIVEWDQVTRLGGMDTLSFQVVFSNDTNLGVNSIEFRYKTLNGPIAQATIGIEDADGVDGIKIDNSSVSSGTSLRFTYPGDTSRFKAYPKFQSALLRARTARIPATVRNTSSASLPPDIYNVTYARVSGATNWTVSLLNGSGQPLVDTSGDPDLDPDTSLVASGASFDILVQMSAPPSATIGNYLQISVTFTSVRDPAKSVTITRQGAISAPFVQGFADTAAGCKLQAANAIHNITRPVNSPGEYLYDLAVAPASNFNYFTAWSFGIGNHNNIRYAQVGMASANPPVIRQLVDNPEYTKDHSVSIAVAPNGITGLAYIRTMQNQYTGFQNKNVYFARIDPSGIPLNAPVNITGNEEWGTPDDVGKPFFSTVGISTTPDNHYVITWARRVKQQDSTIRQDIFIAVYNAENGQQLTAPQQLTSSTSTAGFISPSLSPLNSSTDTFLTYISNEPSSPNPIKLWGVTLNNLGQKTGVDLQLAVINGTQVDTAQLSSGIMLAAWIDNTSLKPVYAVWFPGTTTLPKPPLEPPDGRSMRQIAVTYDQYGHGIISWGDQQGNRIYYALVDSFGNLITPPMIQRSSDTSAIDLGASVFSSAFLADPFLWSVNLPVVRK